MTSSLPLSFLSSPSYLQLQWMLSGWDLGVYSCIHVPIQAYVEKNQRPMQEQVTDVFANNGLKAGISQHCHDMLLALLLLCYVCTKLLIIMKLTADDATLPQWSREHFFLIDPLLVHSQQQVVPSKRSYRIEKCWKASWVVQSAETCSCGAQVLWSDLKGSSMLADQTGSLPFSSLKPNSANKFQEASSSWVSIDLSSSPCNYTQEFSLLSGKRTLKWRNCTKVSSQAIEEHKLWSPDA